MRINRKKRVLEIPVDTDDGEIIVRISIKKVTASRLEEIYPEIRELESGEISDGVVSKMRAVLCDHLVADESIEDFGEIYDECDPDELHKLFQEISAVAGISGSTTEEKKSDAATGTEESAAPAG